MQFCKIVAENGLELLVVRAFTEIEKKARLHKFTPKSKLTA